MKDSNGSFVKDSNGNFSVQVVPDSCAYPSNFSWEASFDDGNWVVDVPYGYCAKIDGGAVAYWNTHGGAIPADENVYTCQ